MAEHVARALAEDIAPALAMDGTQVELIELVEGVARIRFTGMGAGCPCTVMALLMTVEEELRRRAPEVQYIESLV